MEVETGGTGSEEVKGEDERNGTRKQGGEDREERRRCGSREGIEGRMKTGGVGLANRRNGSDTEYH